MINADSAALPGSPEAILQMHWWTEKLLSFRSTRPAGFTFKAGQYARLGLLIDGQMLWRAYSITSAPQDDFLEYLVVTVVGGAFSDELKKRASGDVIHIDRKSFGFMTPDRFADGEALWMIATGTGLGPYLSMLRERAVWDQFRHLILVHGVREASEFAYADLLQAMATTPPYPGMPARLTIVQAVTRSPDFAAVSALHGRVTTLLESGALEQAARLPLQAATSRVMLCGNPAMIEDMRKLLHAREMRPCRRALAGQFVTENYW